MSVALAYVQHRRRGGELCAGDRMIARFGFRDYITYDTFDRGCADVTGDQKETLPGVVVGERGHILCKGVAIHRQTLTHQRFSCQPYLSPSRFGGKIQNVSFLQVVDI
jgi:hypothetical protein